MLFVILNKQEAEMAVIRTKQYFKFQIIYSLHHFYPCGESPFVQFIELCLRQLTKKNLILWVSFLFLSIYKATKYYPNIEGRQQSISTLNDVTWHYKIPWLGQIWLFFTHKPTILFLCNHHLLLIFPYRLVGHSYPLFRPVMTHL